MKSNEENITYSYDDGLILSKDRIIKLSYTENEIMKNLILNRRKYTDRKELANLIYSGNWSLYYETNISVYISRLRAKLKGIIAIDNRYGYGYKIRKVDNEEEYQTKYEVLYKF